MSYERVKVYTVKATCPVLAANTKTQLHYMETVSHGKHMKTNNMGHVTEHKQHSERPVFRVLCTPLAESEEFRLFLARSQAFPLSFLLFFSLTYKLGAS